MSPPPTHYKLIFTVPASHLQACKDAIFSAGAGTYGPQEQGKYTQVCFETSGVEQFKPGNGANPALGKIGELERVEARKVEVLCVGEEVVKRAVGRLKE